MSVNAVRLRLRSAWRLARVALSGAMLIGLVSPAAAAPSTRAECEAAGGTWGRFGMRQQELCDLPAADAGKPCRDSKECVSACVAPDAAAVGSAADGTCYGRTLVLGTCLRQMRDGVVTSPLCAD